MRHATFCCGTLEDTMAKNFLKAALSGIILVGMAGAAFAAPAIATSNVNVRSGPGTNYQAINTLLRGDRVDVEGCQAGWCYVDGHGVEGWVSWRYLAESSRPSRPATVFQFNFGSPPRWDAPRPPRPTPGPSRPGPGRPGGDWDGPGRPGNDWNGPGRPGGDNSPGRPGNNEGNWGHGGNSGPGRPGDNHWNGPRGIDGPNRGDCATDTRAWPMCRN